MKRFLFVFSAIILIGTFSSCDNANDNKVSLTIQPSNLIQSTDGILSHMSTDEIIQYISDSLTQYYRTLNIRGDYFEGETIDYNVYYIKDAYIIAKIEQEEEENNYLNGIFRIQSDYSFIPEVISDSNKCKSIWHQSDMQFLCSSSLYIEKDSEVTYEDYDGKDEEIKELTNAIRNRYFDFSDGKDAGDMPIFSETTKTQKVYLMDFDQKTQKYYILIVAEDSNIYDAYFYYTAADNNYTFEEEADSVFSMNEIREYKDSTNDNADLQDFMDYYDYMMSHKIAVVE